MADYGMFKVWVNRARANIALLQALMIFYLFIDKASWHWWYTPILIVLVILNYYDTRKGLRKEIEYIARRNTYLMEIHEKIMKGK